MLGGGGLAKHDTPSGEGVFSVDPYLASLTGDVFYSMGLFLELISEKLFAT